MMRRNKLRPQAKASPSGGAPAASDEALTPAMKRLTPAMKRLTPALKRLTPALKRPMPAP